MDHNLLLRYQLSKEKQFIHTNIFILKKLSLILYIALV